MIIMKDLHILDLYACELVCKKLYNVCKNEYFKENVYKYSNYEKHLIDREYLPYGVGFLALCSRVHIAIFYDDYRIINTLVDKEEKEENATVSGNLEQACLWYRPNIIKYFVKRYINDDDHVSIYTGMLQCAQYGYYLGLKDILGLYKPCNEYIESIIEAAVYYSKYDVLCLLYLNIKKLCPTLSHYFESFKMHKNMVVIEMGIIGLIKQIKNIEDYFIT